MSAEQFGLPSFPGLRFMPQAGGGGVYVMDPARGGMIGGVHRERTGWRPAAGAWRHVPATMRFEEAVGLVAAGAEPPPPPEVVLTGDERVRELRRLNGIADLYLADMGRCPSTYDGRQSRASLSRRLAGVQASIAAMQASETS